MKGAPFIVLALVGAAASPAAACSFSWREGYSPADIRQRDDVRVVTGTFRNVEGRGEPGEDGLLARGVITGEIVDQAGRRWPTTQLYDSFSAECGANLAPTGPAAGRFWISRRRTDNRYTMMMWEGRPLPADAAQQGRPE